MAIAKGELKKEGTIRECKFKTTPEEYKEAAHWDKSIITGVD